VSARVELSEPRLVIWRLVQLNVVVVRELGPNPIWNFLNTFVVGHRN
jgi:hypothetical protein